MVEEREVAGEGGQATVEDSRLGPVITRPKAGALCFFFLGADTCFHTICFPNTTRASLSCLSVSQIETRCFERPSISCEKTKT